MKRFLLPNNENCSLSDFDVAMQATPQKKTYQRMLAVRSLLLGISFLDVCKIFIISERSLRTWIRKFNEKGIDGLVAQKSSGRPKIISEKETERLKDFVKEPEKTGEVHWTAKKFHGFLREEIGKEISYSSVVRWLHEENFSLKIPRPWPGKQDEDARKAFKDRLKELLRKSENEIWFQDEMGIEADPRPRKRWATKGETCQLTRSGQHLRSSVSGIVCPRTGDFYAFELPYSDKEMFQFFLDKANKDISFTRKKNILICDNASWHKSKDLNWGKFEVMYLPPYSPDFNPIERLWKLVKNEWFSDFYTDDETTLSERIYLALKWLIDRKNENKKTTKIGNSF